MIFLAIYGASHNHSAVRRRYENTEKQFTSGVWRKKVKMISFKPIDDNTSETTL